MATTHYNLPSMPTGAVDWPAIINDIVAKVEVGRTIKATAGETLAAGKAFYIKAADGKAYLATYTTGIMGLWQSSSTSAGVEGFGQIGGIITDATWTWTPGAYIYIDGSSVLTETDPGTGVRAVAYALSATELLILPDAEHTHDMSGLVAGNLDIARMPLGGTWNYTSDIIMQPSATTLDGLIVRAKTEMGATTFTGAGLDDLTYSGTYVGVSDTTYRAEIDGVVTGAITAFADSVTAPGVDTTVTSAAHGRSNGDVVVITGTTSYNGTWTIENVATDTFDIVTAFVADDATGTWELSPNTFKWSNDGGATYEATGVAITGAAQELENGVTVTIAALTGHTAGDYWDIPVTAFSGSLFEGQDAAGTPLFQFDGIGGGFVRKDTDAGASQVLTLKNLADKSTSNAVELDFNMMGDNAEKTFAHIKVTSTNVGFEAEKAVYEVDLLRSGILVNALHMMWNGSDILFGIGKTPSYTLDIKGTDIKLDGESANDEARLRLITRDLNNVATEYSIIGGKNLGKWKFNSSDDSATYMDINDNVVIGGALVSGFGSKNIIFYAGTAEAIGTDKAALFAKDVAGVAGATSMHMSNELASNLIVPAVVYKTDTGDPAYNFEGMMVINTIDNHIKMYADGALRQIHTWGGAQPFEAITLNAGDVSNPALQIGSCDFYENAIAGNFVYKSSLVQDTGDEVGLLYDMTVNKATSGDAYGLRINITDTSSPGSIYPFSISDNSIVVKDGNINFNSGTLFVDSVNNKVGIGTTSSLASKLHINGGTGSLATGIAFGNGDSGIWEQSDNQFYIGVNGGSQWRIDANFLGSTNSGQSTLLRANVSATTPGLLPRAGDINTGIGSSLADNLDFITGGVNALHIDSSQNIGIGTTSPLSKLDVNGSIGWLRVATATDVSTSDEVIIGVTDTSAARTVTILTADIVANRIFIIKDESGAAATNNITVATEGAETIDGAASYTISTNYGVVRMYSNGTNLFTF